MHPVIKKLRDNAGKERKRIVFPEINDDRILAAVDILNDDGIADPVLLSPDMISNENKRRYAAEYERIRRGKVSESEAMAQMDDPLYYSMMMVRCGDVDGVVAGAEYTSADVARATFRCMDVDPRCGLITSCFLMALPDDAWGEQGIYIYADCGIIPYPTAQQLAGIGLAAAYFVQDILKYDPRVAFLSYSTKGSAGGPHVDKVKEAVAMARERAPQMAIDGELQADAAILPEIARRKLKDSPVAGRANVMIFPNLDAGNICYKLTERLANARALGPLILGTVQPCSDLSRGCSPDDVVDCTAITVVKAQMREAAGR